MAKKETAVPAQKSEDKAIFCSPEAGKSFAARDQAEAEQKFKQMLGEDKPAEPKTDTPE